MKSARIASSSASRYLSSGPLVWVATIACTTLLLVLLKQALWLVVPFLLAIILYYALFPAVRRLTLAGVDRETAAAIVAGGSLVAAVAAMVPTLPWLAAQAVSGEEALFRYLAGGQALIDRTLAMLESQFGFLKEMDFHAEMSRKMSEFGGTYVKEHLTDALLGAAAWLPALLLAPFLAFFFLRDGRRFLKFLGDAVPNAYFERTLYMIDRVDATARAYFQGLLKLTLIDTICLALGLAAIGMPGAFALGLMAAVLAWVPFVGSVIGCVIVVLVAATDFPADPVGRLRGDRAVPVRAAARRFRVHAADGRPQPAHASAADGAADIRRRGGRGNPRPDPGAAARRRRHGGRRHDRRHRQRSAVARPARVREDAAGAAHHRRPALLNQHATSPPGLRRKGDLG